MLIALTVTGRMAQGRVPWTFVFRRLLTKQGHVMWRPQAAISEFLRPHKLSHLTAHAHLGQSADASARQSDR